MVKMQGGVFGAVSDSAKFIAGLRERRRRIRRTIARCAPSASRRSASASASAPFQALADVSLKVRPATVHGLLGENGAGKSTLVKCLLGYYRADEGSFLVDNHEATIERPADADALGLGMVYQHFTLVPSMTVAENLVMSRSNVPAVIDWRAEHDGTGGRSCSACRSRCRWTREVGTLAAGERQKTEIIKQLYLRTPVPGAGRADLGADAAGGGGDARPGARAGAFRRN